MDSPDTDFPPTQVDHPPPPSPIPHTTSVPLSPIMNAEFEPAPRRRRIGGEDARDAERAGASSGEETLTEEEKKTVRMWEKG